MSVPKLKEECMASLAKDLDTIQDNGVMIVAGEEYILENDEVAEKLHDIGYRKQSDVVAEFSRRLRLTPIKCGLPLFGLSTKREIEEYFDDIMLQVRDAIDNIAKEMQ